MKYTVINRGLSVGHINITAVASSSVFLVGDTESIVCSSIFDTPPESLIISAPFVPLASS
ncbi:MULTISPECIES: spore gernimation protein GerPD [Bacillales]|uniref:spore gernimation protein GerPD n=1 Tax=Bacillales TaxID=1385 RepID=UPI001883D0E7|nr:MULTISPECIES: spore gernimation protein GerPD [Bacillaceae]MBF0708093.1 spore gernimation protein GerPD [Pseudalkalibacillus hwajinpoensis]MDO6658590.1 spore gernimation protein GerPD [Anaerobacillus sp. 1_MG-2023]WLR59421.1 spore gernimation protein GerPD [Pseudalkalibacillus hwajinpoensis]